MFKLFKYDRFFNKWRLIRKDISYNECQELINKYDYDYSRLCRKLRCKHYELRFKIEKC